MSAWERILFWGGVMAMAAAALALLMGGALGAEPDPGYATPQLEQCIGATCKVVAEDGSTGTGVIYGTQVYEGRRYVLVATAAHVVRRAARATLFVGRGAVRVTGRVLLRNHRTDVGCILVPSDDFKGRLPARVRIGKADLILRQGQAVFSVGCPNGGELQLWTGYIRGYAPDGALMFWPGPELGRSGSPLFIFDEENEPEVVGLVSARYTPHLGPDTMGKAVTTAMMWSGETPTAIAPAVAEWPVQCMGPGCIRNDGAISYYDFGTPAQRGQDVSPYRVLPYRQQNDQKIGQLQQEIKGLEKSPGTLPLPPVAPPVDLAPLSQRLMQLEGVVNQHSQELGKLQMIADKAMVLADAVAKRDGEFARDLAAVRGETAEAKKAVTEALDEESPNGLLARLKARIEAVKTEGLGAVLAEAGWLKWGLIGLAVAVAYLFLRREGARAAAGEPTVAQRIAAMTPTEVDDRIAGRLAAVQAAIHERLGEIRGHMANLAGKTPTAPPTPPST